MNITAESMRQFECALRERERSEATIGKYVSAVERMAGFLEGQAVTKDEILRFRNFLYGRYGVQTVNGFLSAVNAFFEVLGIEGCKVRLLRIQRRAFLDERRMMTKEEYSRLLKAARAQNKPRLELVMRTLGGTGIRISELGYITVEAVKRGRAEIRMKGKCRIVLLAEQLRAKLFAYARKQGISSGAVFRTRGGKPLNRSNI